MGRLRKEIQDKIRRMHRQGYTKVEISEETGCHPETIDKYIEEEEQEEAAIIEEPTQVDMLRSELQEVKRKQTRLQNAIGSLWAESLRPLPCPHCKSRAGISYRHGWRCRNCDRDVFEVSK